MEDTDFKGGEAEEKVQLPKAYYDAIPRVGKEAGLQAILFGHLHRQKLPREDMDAIRSVLKIPPCKKKSFFGNATFYFLFFFLVRM